MLYLTDAGRPGIVVAVQWGTPARGATIDQFGDAMVVPRTISAVGYTATVPGIAGSRVIAVTLMMIQRNYVLSVLTATVTRG